MALASTCRRTAARVAHAVRATRPPVPFSTAVATVALWLGVATLLVACQSTLRDPASPAPAGTPPVATATPAPATPVPDSERDATPAPTATPTPSLPGPDSQGDAATVTPTAPATNATSSPASRNNEGAAPTGAPSASATPDQAALTPTGGSAAQPAGRPPAGARGPGSASSSDSRQARPEGATEYTWQDGEHTRRAWLGPPGDTGASGEQDASGHSDPRGDSDGSPVFYDDSGRRMTLPGGVLLVLDPAWDQGRVDDFFAANGIAAGRVEEEDFTTNAYFISTDPGLPSLLLANELADEEGVLISSPNWRSQVVLR